MREPLAIVLLTYGATPERHEYAMKTLDSTLRGISYEGAIHVHIADDGSPGSHRRALGELAQRYVDLHSIHYSNAERGGYGRNFNLAGQATHAYARYILPIEDDWELLRPLDLNPLADALEDERVGCIRLGYLGFTRDGGLRGSWIHAGEQTFFLFDPDSEEPHIFAGHPRLESVAWERSVGPWPEQIPETGAYASPGDVEFMVAHIRAARAGVVWPFDLVKPYGDLFAHIGTVRSW